MQTRQSGVDRPGIRNPSICGVPSERLKGVPRSPRVAPSGCYAAPRCGAVGNVLLLARNIQSLDRVKRRECDTSMKAFLRSAARGVIGYESVWVIRSGNPNGQLLSLAPSSLTGAGKGLARQLSRTC